MVRMRSSLVWIAVVLLTAGAAMAQQAGQPPAQQQPAQRQIVLTIMSSEVNNFAPGIDASVKLSQEQANQLAAAYREVYQGAAVILANMVLQDNGSSMDQRRVAQFTLQQAQQLFQAKARAVFTEPQQQLIDKVQAAFTKIFEKAQAEFQARLKADFNAQLDTLLSPEQKQAMMVARKAIEDAQRKAAEQQKAATPAPATPPATTPPATAPK